MEFAAHGPGSKFEPSLGSARASRRHLAHRPQAWPLTQNSGLPQTPTLIAPELESPALCQLQPLKSREICSILRHDRRLASVMASILAVTGLITCGDSRWIEKYADTRQGMIAA